MPNKKGAPMQKIALAYSGGLDTSVMIPWLKEHHQVGSWVKKAETRPCSLRKVMAEEA